MLRITLEQLEVLEAIDREGSFAAAARATHRSTPAVSYAVKALEEGLEVVLFDRSGHRAVLTGAGRLILAESRRVLSGARELGHVARQLREGWEPEVVLVIDGLLPMRRIMDAVRQLARLGAPSRIRVRVEYLTGVHHAFLEEDAQLMIGLDLRQDARLVRQELPAVALRLCVRRDHPLAALASVDRRALSDHVELVVADSGRQAPSGHRLWLGSPSVFQVSDFATKVDAVRAGVGFGWLPEHLVEADLDSGELVVLPFTEGDRHAFVPHLAWRAGRPRGRAARFFTACLLEGPGVEVPSGARGVHVDP